jgi:hypothetical protein
MKFTTSTFGWPWRNFERFISSRPLSFLGRVPKIEWVCFLARRSGANAAVCPRLVEADIRLIRSEAGFDPDRTLAAPPSPEQKACGNLYCLNLWMWTTQERCPHGAGGASKPAVSA